ncbi:adenosine deaminase family protein [Salidesulfovibrio brasiliensis]|uniref:adenosine deaminase family protein n=1 Tax=Salidesulfovibrio brasiliensis TaxID=221711 RepID=UPI0006D10771|nr:adenosine deaminase [Salidesulfovibrio brasiliensis]
MKRISMLPVVVAVLFCVFLSACTAGRSPGLPAQDPVVLRMLLAQMPKGAELHTHLSGIPYGEHYIAWAAKDGACIQSHTGRIVPGPCNGTSIDAAKAYAKPDLWNAEVNALSVRQDRRDNRMWGHDQFFATFGLFGEAKDNKARMIAHAARQAARDRVQYLELMISIYGPQWVTPWAEKAGWDGDPAATLERLRSAGLFKGIPEATAWLDDTGADVRKRLGNGPGSDVGIRYINQIFRGAEPEYVFAQLAWSFELASRDPRVVAVNMVGPEDSPISVRDYAMHMDMIDFLHSRYPDVAVALHAGELTGGLTTPEALSDHIRLAVTKGHAKRIGHGIDIAYEDDPQGTLAFMRENRVALEVLLSSNDVILRVSGREHPLRTYMAAGVPVVLSTDDMGVGRTTLTNEYVRAVTDQGLTYADLKRAARNSLEFSFLPGISLWMEGDYERMAPACRGDERPDKDCAALLGSSEKAAQQWKLEQRLRMFEARN